MHRLALLGVQAPSGAAKTAAVRLQKRGPGGRVATDMRVMLEVEFGMSKRIGSWFSPRPSR